MVEARDTILTAVKAVIQAGLNAAAVGLATWQTTDVTKPIIIATATAFVATLTTRGALEGWWNNFAAKRAAKRAAARRLAAQPEASTNRPNPF